MNASRRDPWDDETARACGITWLLAETAPAGAFGRSARAARAAYGPGDEAAARAAIEACATLARKAGVARLASLRSEIARVPDLEPAARRAQSGGALADADAYEALRFASALRAIGATGRDAGIDFEAALEPQGLTYRAALEPGATDGGGFYLSDAFDAGLAASRERAANAAARLDLERSRIETAIARAVGRDAVRGREFVVMRERLREPLPASVRVIREAPSYVLCESTLDEGGLAALAASDAADLEVAAREEAVRVRLAAAVAADADAIASATHALGRLDLAIAEAAFAARYDTCVPEIPDELVLELDAAMFLPYAEGARPFVPLDLELSGASVVTGPNMGGKTTALRTACFAAACVALGLPVPAARARIALVSHIVWLAPAETSALERGLSAFGAEIVRVRELFAKPGRRALVAIDEFARTTTPREGRALLVALIEGLRERGALVFAATHASGVAAASGAAPLAVVGLRAAPALPSSGALPLASALAAIADLMEYRVVRVDPGAPPRSDAIALARALGLDDAVARRAEQIARETLE